MATVRQSGGDYGTLNAAMASAETTIDIDQSWTVADTTKATCSTANTTVTVSGGAAHPGYISGGNYYRLEGSGGHVITVNSAGFTIIGAVIKQAGTGSSDEGIRIASTGTHTVRRCIIYGNASFTANQDGIYTDLGITLTVEQTYIYNFARSGVNMNVGTSGATYTLNFNSSLIYDCNQSGETSGGGINENASKTDITATLNIYNSIVLKSTAGTDDYRARTIINATWNISRSVASDSSITAVRDNGDNNYASRSWTDNASPGTGDWIVFNDVTTYPFDFRLKSSAENDAQDQHATATAHGLTIPSTDIVGTTRPQNTNYDLGPFEIVAGGAPTVSMPPRRIHPMRFLGVR